MAAPKQSGNRKELEAYLAHAPEELRDWADAQLAALEAEGADIEDVLGEDAAEDPDPKPKPETPAPSKLQRKTGLSKVNLVLVALLAAAVVIIIQQLGRADPQSDSLLPMGHPDISSTAMPTDLKGIDEAVPVDTKREAELKSTIEANPANQEARQELGVMYIKAALYQQASTVLQEILDTDPNNLDALLSIGLAEFQQNHFDQAENYWKQAEQVKPDAAEPWYNLGFLYMAKTPPDQQQAQECWEKVLQIAPNSDMAANVRGHQNRMGSPHPEATPNSGG